jgi:hypothetical protein
MKIAFVGWGSLYWNPSGLKIKGEWKEDGPCLPVEFARQSEKIPLTLVLFPQASDVQTLWALSKITSLEEAIIGLAKREETSAKNIGYYSRLDGNSRCNVIPEALERIRKWTDEKELDATVWADLPAKFRVDLAAEVANGSGLEVVHDIRTEVSEENVLAYISQLSAKDTDIEKNYVIRTHDQIDTRIRRMLKLEFGWRSLAEYKHGFWLDENTFIMADDAEIKKVRKPSIMSISQESVEEDMLILTNAVEMTVDNHGKILGENKHEHFGLWLDTVNKAIAEHERKKERAN